MLYIRPSASSGLENAPPFSYTLSVVDSLFGYLPIGTSAKYIRPSLLALRQELVGRKLGVKKSSPRLAARDGMEQEPYEFWIRLQEFRIKG
jgi:hypothetical protein